VSPWLRVTAVVVAHFNGVEDVRELLVLLALGGPPATALV